MRRSILLAVFACFAGGTIRAQDEDVEIYPILPVKKISILSAVSFSADGKKVAAVARSEKSKRLLIWDAATGKAPRAFPDVKGLYPGSKNSVALSTDGKRLVTGHLEGGKAALWNTETGKQIRAFARRDPVFDINPVLGVACSGDGRRIFASLKDGVSVLWDAASGDEMGTLRHGILEERVAISADGERVVTISAGGKAVLAEPTKGKELPSFPTESLVNIALSADGKRLATTSSLRSKIVLWDATTGKELRTFQAEDKETIESLALSHDGKRAIAGFSESGIVWDAETGRKTQTLKERLVSPDLRFASSLGVALSPDGALAWTAGETHMQVWDLKTGDELCKMLVLNAGEDWLVVTPDGYFDGSKGAAKLMAWRAQGTFTPIEDDTLLTKRHRPGLLAELCKGKQPEKKD